MIHQHITEDELFHGGITIQALVGIYFMVACAAPETDDREKSLSSDLGFCFCCVVCACVTRPS